MDIFFRSNDPESKMSLEKTLEQKASGTLLSTEKRMYPKTRWAKRVATITSYFEKNRMRIFWATLYTLVSIGIFAERAYCKLSAFLSMLDVLLLFCLRQCKRLSNYQHFDKGIDYFLYFSVQELSSILSGIQSDDPYCCRLTSEHTRCYNAEYQVFQEFCTLLFSHIKSMS